MTTPEMEPESAEHRPPLVVFLAAGASMDLGYPGTWPLTEAILDAIRAATRDLVTPDGLIPGGFDAPVPDRAVWEALQQQNPSANFETLMHALEAIRSLRRSWRDSTSARFRVVEAALTSGPPFGLLSAFGKYWADESIRVLLRVIAEQMSRDVSAHENFAPIRAFLVDLQEQFDTYIVTTNYDTLAEQCLDLGPEAQGFVPYSDQWWAFRKHREPNRLMHLHGSIHFGYPDTHRVDEDYNLAWTDHWEDQFWTPAPNDALQTWFGRSNASSQAGRDTIVGPFVTGLQKADKLLFEPYHTYYRHLGDLVARVPRVLIVGYGFNDQHFNRLFDRMLTWHGEARRCVLIDYFTLDQWTDIHGPASSKYNLLMSTARLAGVENNRDRHADDVPEVWRASEFARVYVRGLADAARAHGEDIIDYLMH